MYILHHFRDTADNWSNFRCQQGVPLFNTFVQRSSLNSGLRNSASRN